MPDAGLTGPEINKLVYGYIGVEGGYLGDFSYSKHREFYIDLDLDINPDTYEGTTRQRFTTILKEQPPGIQARILEGILARYPPEENPKRAARTPEIRAWIARLKGAGGIAPPTPLGAPAAVEIALGDANDLLRAGKPLSAVDRIHTALYGYLRDVCQKAKIVCDPKDSITKLYKQLREHHPALAVTGPHAASLLGILAAFGSVLDTLNTLRNQASLAHPNEQLLSDSEASLAINAALTVFNYLEDKLQKTVVKP